MKRLLLSSLVLFSLTTSPVWAGEGKGSSTQAGQVTREYVLSQTSVPTYGFKVMTRYPHESSSYTEGLVMDEGVLYEGTGRYGRSNLYRGSMTEGSHLNAVDLNERYFGEGVTVMGDKVYQLTYKSNLGFIYNKSDLSQVGEFSYTAQGWGLTHDDKHIIMSNGSAALLFLDPATMQPVRQVIVSDEQGPIGFLNELEYVDGQIYANIWQTDLIARIDPATGKITGWLDLTGLNPDPDLYQYPFVLNGIAYNPKTRRLLVTGKCWPHIYEIEMVPNK